MDSLNLDRRSVVPLYYQIQQHLLQDIRSGKFKPGKPVPSEAMISKRLGVSRMTARQALKSLCHLGVAYSQRGKGTFVSRIKLEKEFRHVLSFSEEMAARGSRPRSRLLAFDCITPSDEIAEALHLSPDQQVIRLRRVRMADSLSMAVECTHLPLHLCPDLAEKFDPRNSLYAFLTQRYGIKIELTDEVVEAGLASAEEARLLRIRKGSPVFLFTRTSYGQSSLPVEYVKSVYRGDRYKIANRLTCQPGATRGG